MIGSFKRKPLIHFFWGELPDAKRRQNFAKAEAVIQLIEGNFSLNTISLAI